ncbi:MAG: nucleotide-binding protein [Chloroflexi bacterium]|nr:nucleotide-binding protein [Chloroflexota bacterium]
MIHPQTTQTTQTEAVLLLRDTFDQDRAPGKVIGSQAPGQPVRQGVDAEGIIGIDNHALRIQPLLNAGWGRAGIAYGPYERQNGLALSVFMVNAHNTSQLDDFADTLRRRLFRWSLGSAPWNEKSIILKRMARWITTDHPSRFVRRVRWWRALRQNTLNPRILDENLAVGWFPEVAPGPSMPAGSGFVMHALGANNGELWAIGGASPLPAVHGVQNIQIYYIVILRERGAAYYAASVQDANGMSVYPGLRPLAIEPFRDDPQVYAGVHQSVIGQIGFRNDTRVYGVSVAAIPELAQWYGTAHAADSLLGGGNVQGSEAEIGGRWTGDDSAFLRTKAGAVAGTGAESVAVLTPDTPSGLIHTVLEGSPGGRAGLIWRAESTQDHWRLWLDDQGCHLAIVRDGRLDLVASGQVDPQVSAKHSLQVLDDGRTIAATLDGVLLFGKRFDDARLANAHGVGLWAEGSGAHLHHFEAHPRTVPMHPSLDLGAPWYRLGQKVVVSESFAGPARSLEGKETTTGGKVWERTVGRGYIDLLGNDTARVRATVQEPNPGRTAFTFDWDNAQFADLELEMVPPGVQRGQGERGRTGVVFWQDADNYIVVAIYLDDDHPGVSISSFFHLNGFEEVYDAVWTMLTRHVTWGKSFRLRVVFDGLHYMALVNDEAVLYRALTDVYPKFTPLSITRVGLLVNWEWGDDTGTTLINLSAKV